ncbi:hypothetical protein, partial [Duncaniella muris]
TPAGSPPHGHRFTISPCRIAPHGHPPPRTPAGSPPHGHRFTISPCRTPDGDVRRTSIYS